MRVEATAHLRRQHHPKRLWKRQQTGLERRATEARLLELGERVEQPEEGTVTDEGHARAGGEEAVLQQPHVEHRVQAPELVPRQPREQSDARDARHEHPRGIPAMAGPLAQRVHHPGQAEACEQEATDVEAIAGLGTALAEEQGAEDHGGETNRHIDEEDPPPGRLIDQQAADDRAHHGSQHRRNHENARCADALLRRERAKQHRQPDRQQHAAADALQNAEADELSRLVERPQSPEETVKIPKAKSSTRLSPKRSPSHPATGMKTARLTRYPDATALTAAASAPNSTAIVGSATLTMVVSRIDMNVPVTKTMLIASFGFRKRATIAKTIGSSVQRGMERLSGRSGRIAASTTASTATGTRTRNTSCSDADSAAVPASSPFGTCRPP